MVRHDALLAAILWDTFACSEGAREKAIHLASEVTSVTLDAGANSPRLVALTPTSGSAWTGLAPDELIKQEGPIGTAWSILIRISSEGYCLPSRLFSRRSDPHLSASRFERGQLVPLDIPGSQYSGPGSFRGTVDAARGTGITARAELLRACLHRPRYTCYPSL